MITKKMNWLPVLVLNFLLVDMTLALALAGKKVEAKDSQVTGAASAMTAVSTLAPPVVISQAPVKATVEEGGRPEVGLPAAETVEKSLPKKRGVFQDLYYKRPIGFDESEFDPNDDVAPEEFFTAPQRENGEGAYFKGNGNGVSAFGREDGYFDTDARTKRTAILGGIYSSPQDFTRPDVELSPEEVIALLRLIEERRLYNNPVQNRWSDYDNSVDSIEADMRDEDEYKEREGSRFGEPYERNYEGNGRYPTGMKRFMITKRNRNDFLGTPKIKVPVFRRAIL